MSPSSPSSLYNFSPQFQFSSQLYPMEDYCFKFIVNLPLIISLFILVGGRNLTTTPRSEALEIGIGIGIGGRAGEPAPPQEEWAHNPCPPPPPPPPPPEPVCPPPQPPPRPPPLSASLLKSYYTIQNFKPKITCDPKQVTKTWVGMTQADICNHYKGFFCEIPPGRKDLAVAAIDFNGFGLCAPSISEFINNFTDLALFHANSNNFSGTLTAGIAKLPFLRELDVSNNKMSGEFPVAVNNIKMLSFLDLRYNSFAGSVPGTILMKKLDVFFINNNNFMQSLPENLGSTPALYLTFANNKFTGSIPGSIGDASKTLQEVLFLNNQLTGCLPYEIGNLKKATVFDAGYNSLVGPIPETFGCLQRVEQLNFAGNKLSGPIPEVVCALGKLENLSLSDNYFTSVGPLCKKLIQKKVLLVEKNCIFEGCAGLPPQRSKKECDDFLCKPTSCPCPPTIPCDLPAPPHVSPIPTTFSPPLARK